MTLITNRLYSVSAVECSRMEAIDRGLYKRHPHFRMWHGRWQCIGWQSWVSFGKRVEMLMAGDGETSTEAYHNWNHVPRSL